MLHELHTHAVENDFPVDRSNIIDFHSSPNTTHSHTKLFCLPHDLSAPFYILSLSPPLSPYNLYNCTRTPAATPASQLQASTPIVDTFPCHAAYEILSTVSTPAASASTCSTYDVIKHAFPARRRRVALNLVPQDSLAKLPTMFSTKNQAASSILRTRLLHVGKEVYLRRHGGYRDTRGRSHDGLCAAQRSKARGKDFRPNLFKPYPGRCRCPHAAVAFTLNFT